MNKMHERKTVFIVDDNITNLEVVQNALDKHYTTFTISSAKSLFNLLEKTCPDLILLDTEMSDMNGFEILKLLKSGMVQKYAAIPVIFLTERNDSGSEIHGFELGAVDFIAKPFSAPVLLKRIESHLHIDGLVRERTAKLERLQDSILTALAAMVENRDSCTGVHIEHTSRYIEILLAAMMECGVYTGELGLWDSATTLLSVRLHDVGKIVISDTILNKPGKLDNAEFTLMKTHATAGEKIIQGIMDDAGGAEFLHGAKLFAGYHHERWDGAGYPHGSMGLHIPLQGRVMAVVDVYDALVSARPYKEAYSHDKAVQIIREGRESHFDPRIVDAFLEAHHNFEEIARQAC